MPATSRSVFFEFAWIGIPITIVAIIYMVFLGKYLLPETKVKSHIGEEEEKSDRQVRASKKRMWLSGGILVMVVIFMALDIKALPLHIVAVIGAMLTVLTKCMTEKQAYRSIDWVTSICRNDAGGKSYGNQRCRQNDC